jgi:hypothetical protein
MLTSRHENHPDPFFVCAAAVFLSPALASGNEPKVSFHSTYLQVVVRDCGNMRECEWGVVGE